MREESKAAAAIDKVEAVERAKCAASESMPDVRREEEAERAGDSEVSSEVQQREKIAELPPQPGGAESK